MLFLQNSCFCHFSTSPPTPFRKFQDPSKTKNNSTRHVHVTMKKKVVVGGGVAPAHRAVRSAMGGGVAPWRVDRSPCTRRAGRAWYRRARPPAEGGWRWGGTRSDAADGPWCSRSCVDRAGTAAGCWSAGNGSLGCPARTRHLCTVCV